MDDDYKELENHLKDYQTKRGDSRVFDECLTMLCRDDMYGLEYDKIPQEAVEFPPGLTIRTFNQLYLRPQIHPSTPTGDVAFLVLMIHKFCPITIHSTILVKEVDLQVLMEVVRGVVSSPLPDPDIEGKCFYELVRDLPPPKFYPGGPNLYDEMDPDTLNELKHAVEMAALNLPLTNPFLYKMMISGGMERLDYIGRLLYEFDRKWQMYIGVMDPLRAQACVCLLSSLLVENHEERLMGGLQKMMEYTGCTSAKFQHHYSAFDPENSTAWGNKRLYNLAKGMFYAFRREDNPDFRSVVDAVTFEDFDDMGIFTSTIHNARVILRTVEESESLDERWMKIPSFLSLTSPTQHHQVRDPRNWKYVFKWLQTHHPGLCVSNRIFNVGRCSYPAIYSQFEGALYPECYKGVPRQLYIHPHLASDVRECKGDILVTLMVQEYVTDQGHANAVVFDKRTKRVICFDPEGTGDDERYHILLSWLDDQFSEWVKEKMGDEWSYIPSQKICPGPGVQRILENHVFGNKDQCVLLSLLFLHLQLTYPSKEPADVVNIMFEALKSRGVWQFGLDMNKFQNFLVSTTPG